MSERKGAAAFSLIDVPAAKSRLRSSAMVISARWPRAFRSKFGDRFIERLLVATGNGDLRALRNEKSGCGQTDTSVNRR
jgi:hypothetical protein